MATQESFPEIELPTQEAESRKPPQRAIARVAHEEFWDPELTKALLDTPPDPNAVFAAQPNVLGRSLMPAGHRYDGNYYNGVLFAPDEHEKLVRSPRAFADRVRGKTHISRQADPDFDRRIGKANRSPLHALAGKITGMEKLVATFEKEHEYLEWIRKELQAPGFVHTDEHSLRMVATQAKEHWLWLFEVVALQESWEGDKRQSVFDAMEYLSIGSRRVKGSYHSAVGYWVDMTKLSCQYSTQKRNAVNKNIRSVKNYLDSVQPPAV